MKLTHSIQEPKSMSWLIDGIPGVLRASLVTTTSENAHVEIALNNSYWPDAEASHLRSVSDVFDALTGNAHEPATGWVSAISGEPFPAERMDRWLSEAVEIILERAPQHVLDVGCGTGAVLNHVAPLARRYVGTDLSAAALAHLADSVATRASESSVIELVPRAAHDLAEVDGTFDLVTLNSVVQYFPSADYLSRVLTLAASKLAPSGRIFVGDVRHLGHVADLAIRGAIHASRPETTPEAMILDAERRIAGETELLLRPDFFLDWASAAGMTAEVRLRTSAIDDLGYFRYDITIDRLPPRTDGVSADVEWVNVVDDLSSALTSIAQGRQPVRLRNIPNEATRLAQGLRTLLSADLGSHPDAESASVFPPKLIDASHRLGMRLVRTWPGRGPDREGLVDAVIVPHGSSLKRFGHRADEEIGTVGGPGDTASAPLESVMSARLARRWRRSAPDDLCGLRPVFTYSPPQSMQRRKLVARSVVRTAPAVLDGPAVNVDEGQTLHGLVLQYGERHPDVVALVAGHRHLTHRELRASAEDVARRLRDAGVRQGDVVGLYADRGWELVAGLLGILMSGATYLPLDRDHPPARTKQLLARAGATSAVSTPSAAEGLTDLVADPVLVDGSHRATLAAHQPFDIARDATSSAYLMFTSGSTGEPKGVLVSHAPAVNLLAGLDSILGVPDDPAGKTWLAATNICFDISLAEIFWPLSRGVRLVIADTAGFRGNNTAGDIDLVREFERYAVTHFQSTPSLIRLLLADPRWLNAVEKLDCLVLGGEVVSRELAHELRKARVLVNGYGPTEATVYATMHVVERDGSGPVPIGRPLANVTVRIVGDSLDQLATGEVGEVLIGGAGVAQGYLGPESAQGGFITADIDGVSRRWYRTGDLGCIALDGNLHYLGRRDSQVKVRGYRIELNEVEETIRRHQDVQDCAVIARGADGEFTHLDAAIVLHPDHRPRFSGKTLRSWVAERLPAYMVPTSMVPVSALPVTASGKLDRRAVYDMLTSRVRESQSGEAIGMDADSVRDAVCRVWSEVLGIDDIPIDENFFDVGGNSLLLAQVHQRLAGLLPDPPELLDLFRQPTVSGLVAHLVGGQGPGQRAEAAVGVARRDRALATDRRRLRA